MKLNIIIFGPPGSGKGTQAKKLVERYDLLHISTGDLFRYEMSNDTKLGKRAKAYMAKGQLVPDEVTIGMLKNKVDSNPDAIGYILDGFPRTIFQAEALRSVPSGEAEEVSILIALKVTDDEIVKRILERGKISGRSDDNDEAIIRSRIAIYNKETSPIFNYYAHQGKSVHIEGIGSVDEIFQNLCNVIDKVEIS